MWLKGHGLLIIWVLFLNGCDYWDNLFKEFEYETGSLHIEIKDIWTKEKINGVAIQSDVSTHSSQFNDTVYVIPSIPAGNRTISISSPQYYENNIEVFVEPGKITKVNAGMVRDSNAWYQDFAKRPRLEITNSPPLQPNESILAKAYPRDTSGLFTYEWMLGSVIQGGDSILNFTYPTAGIDTLFLELGMFIDGRHFHVKTLSQPLEFRNITKFDFIEFNQEKLGCDSLLTIEYALALSNETCKEIKFQTDFEFATTKSFTKPCVSRGRLEIPVYYPPPKNDIEMRKRMRDKPQDEFLSLTATIIETDLKETNSNYLFTVQKNRLPYQDPQFLDNIPFYSGFEKRFPFLAIDHDGSIQKLKFDFGDGTTPVEISPPPGGNNGPDTLLLNLIHQYEEPDTNTVITTTVWDECEVNSFSQLKTNLSVVKNQKPFVEIDSGRSVWDNTNENFTLWLRADDRDFNDSLELVLIYWEEDKGPEGFNNVGKEFSRGKLFIYDYSSNPQDTIMIIVKAFDSFNILEPGIDSLIITR